MQKLKVLVLHLCTFSDCPKRSECGDISKIEVLDVDCCEFGHFYKPPFSRMPYLKELRLSSRDVDDVWFKDGALFLSQLHILDLEGTAISSRTYQAIRNHALNLKKLYLGYVNLDDDDLKCNNSMFPNLTDICVKYCHGVTCEAIVSRIQSCQSLESVYVDENVAEFYAAHPFVVFNKIKLEIVKAIDCDGHQKIHYLYM